MAYQALDGSKQERTQSVVHLLGLTPSHSLSRVPQRHPFRQLAAMQQQCA